MTVGELKAVLANFNDEMRVVFLSDVGDGLEDIQSVEIENAELYISNISHVGHVVKDENENTTKCVVIS